MDTVDINWTHPNQPADKPNVLNKYRYATNILKQIVFFEDGNLNILVLEAFLEYDENNDLSQVQQKIHFKRANDWIEIIDKIVSYCDRAFPEDIIISDLVRNN